MFSFPSLSMTTPTMTMPGPTTDTSGPVTLSVPTFSFGGVPSGGFGNVSSLFSDIVNGENADEEIVVGDNGSIVNGGGGDDTVIGGEGRDTINTDAGGDVATDEEGLPLLDEAGDPVIIEDGDDVVIAGGGDDRIRTGGGDDFIDAGDGNDSVDAGPGNDTIEAGDGNDSFVIRGGAGDDVIAGGSGTNLLQGGEDVDTFVFRAEDAGRTTLLDFDAGAGEVLRFEGFDGLDLEDVLAAAVEVDEAFPVTNAATGEQDLFFVQNDVDITLGELTIRIVGADLADLSEANFDFV